MPGLLLSVDAVPRHDFIERRRLSLWAKKNAQLVMLQMDLEIRLKLRTSRWTCATKSLNLKSPSPSRREIETKDKKLALLAAFAIMVAGVSALGQARPLTMC